MSLAVRVCSSVLVSTHMTSVAVHQYTYQHVVHTGRLWVSASTHITSVAVRVCPCVSVCVRQHTQNVCGCPSVHISARWSLDSARWPFPWSVRVILAHVGCLVSTHRTSVAVRQHTKNVHGCPSAHTGCPWLSVCVRVCPSTHTGHQWLSISTHISTLVLGLSTLALPVDGLGDFGPRGLSVHYTQDICGCPSAHTGRPCVSVSTHRTSVCVRQHTHDVRVCPSAHTGRLWLSISTHISTLVLGLSTLALPVDGLGDFGPSGLSVHYTQDICECPSAHPGCMWLSVCVRQHTQDVRGCPSVHISACCTHRTSVGVRQHTVCPCVSVGTHMTSVAVRVCPCVSVSTHMMSGAVHQYTYQHVGPWTQHADFSPGLFGTHITTLVLGVSTLTLPVDCSGDFSPRGVSGQYIQDVRGCLPAHTGRPWLSVCVSVCLSVSVCTHKTSVAVHHTHRTSVGVCQHTQDICGCPWLSVSTHRTSVAVRQHTEDVCGCPCVSVGVRQHTQGRSCLSVAVCQHIQDVCVCPSAHTGHPCVSVSTHRTSVAVHQYTYQHAGPSRGLFGTSEGVRQHTEDVYGCPFVSVCVRQHTQDVCGCPSVHISARCTHRTSVGVRLNTQDVRVCPSAHTGRPGLSVCVRPHTQDVCGCNYGPRGLSSQYTQDVRGCPPAHTGPPWLSVTHRTSVAVHQCKYQHAGPWTQHAGPSRGLFGTSVGVRQHTEDVYGCPTHIRTLVLGLSMLALPVDCLGDFGRRGLSVQYIQDVNRCLPAHTGHLWLSVSTHRTFVAVRVCLCVSVSTHMTSVAVHQYTYQHVGPWTQHADPSRGLFG
ncbi:hypothetical protein YC2023_066116 [Brassica napus]